MAELQSNMTSREFSEWIAYEETTPGDPERGDLQAAQICCTVANAFRGKNTKPFKPADFLLRFHRPVAESNKELQLKVKTTASGIRALLAANKSKKKVKS